MIFKFLYKDMNLYSIMQNIVLYFNIKLTLIILYYKNFIINKSLIGINIRIFGIIKAVKYIKWIMKCKILPHQRETYRNT